MKQLIVLAALLALGLCDPVINTQMKNVKFGESREEMWRMFGGGKMTVEEKLMLDLMKNYNKYVKPTGVTNLHFSLSFICSHLDKKDFMINTRVLEKYEWTDMRLKWNPTEFNNIRKIRIPAFKIWIPDIKLMNSHMTEERDMDVNVVITNEGRIIFMPMVTYKTHCMKTHEMFMHNIMTQQHTGGIHGGIHGGVHGGVHKGVHGTVQTEGMYGKGLKEELMGVNLGGKYKSSESSSSESSSSSEEMNLQKNPTMFTCKLILGSWSYDDKMIHLTLMGEGLDKTYYSDMCPGDVTDLKVRIKDNVFPESPDEKYPTMIVDFKLKNRTMN